MLQTAVCELLGIQHPIVQAGMGPFGSGAALAAAVSDAGALGSLGGTGRSVEDLREGVHQLGESTDRPFAVNFTQPWIQQNPESMDTVLSLGVPVVSMALGDPGRLPHRVHDVGALFIQQVHTVDQALLVAERGVDIIIAQGTEAGGFGGKIGMAALVPQVVDAVSPLPVLAAGGIADGRGLAASLILGAQGANIGTRFLASIEASVAESWKQAIVEADAGMTTRAVVWDRIFPKPGNGAFDVVPRALETAFIRTWLADPAGAEANATELQQEIGLAIRQGRMDDFVPFAGQSAGLIHDIRAAADIIARLVSEAETALAEVRSRVRA